MVATGETSTIRAGDVVSLVVNVTGDHSAGAFTWTTRNAEISSRSGSVGSYDAGNDQTPVTVSLTADDTSGLASQSILWQLKKTGAQVAAEHTLVIKDTYGD